MNLVTQNLQPKPNSTVPPLPKTGEQECTPCLENLVIGIQLNSAFAEWFSGSERKASAYNAGDLGLNPGMATHSRTLAWKILWTEERGRLQSTGLQRVEHD